MANNKYDFIKELLANKSLSHEKRERILDLASKEMNLGGTLEDRIQKLEDLIVGEATQVVDVPDYELYDKIVRSVGGEVLKEKSSNKSSSYNLNDKFKSISSSEKKHHNPSKVNEWLKYFTIDNTAIKFSTHVWDDDLFNTYGDFIDKLNDERVKYDFHSLQDYNPDLYWNKIYPFLFQNKLTSIQITGEKVFGWGRYKIPIGWQYPSLVKDFCLTSFDNIGQKARVPQTMNLPIDLFQQDIPGRTIKTFEEVIDLFKPEIEFRENQLWLGVKTALFNILPNHKFDKALLDKLKGGSFYTNTEYVLKAVKRIFQMIKSRSTSQELQINCLEDFKSNKYTLEILHLDSYCDRQLIDSKLIASNRGDLSILKTTLLSLCDFSIESRFKDENGVNFFARIDYLYEGVESNHWKPQVTTIDYNPNGFKYILEFII